MVYKITGEQPFQVLSDSFSISPSEQNYVVQVSADGTNYSDLFAVSAGQTKMCTGMSNGSYYRLKNNQSEVSVNWRTTCKGGESGGGGSYILPPATQQTLGGIKVGSGLTVQADGTLSATGGSGSGSSYEPYRIELSTTAPDDFTEGDIDNLNDFFEAVAADPSITKDAYIDIEGEIYRCSWAEYDGGTGLGNFSFVLAYTNWLAEIDLHFEDGEYNEGVFFDNAFNYLAPNAAFPADPIEGQIANYDDGEGNIGLYRFDGEDWVPYGGGGDNSSLNPTTEFPADPVEGQIVNYSDGRLNVGVLYRYDGSDWQPYGGGDNTILKAVSGAPETLEKGDVYALNAPFDAPESPDGQTVYGGNITDFKAAVEDNNNQIWVNTWDDTGHTETTNQGYFELDKNGDLTYYDYQGDKTYFLEEDFPQGEWGDANGIWFRWEGENLFFYVNQESNGVYFNPDVDMNFDSVGSVIGVYQANFKTQPNVKIEVDGDARIDGTAEAPEQVVTNYDGHMYLSFNDPSAATGNVCALASWDNRYNLTYDYSNDRWTLYDTDGETSLVEVGDGQSRSAQFDGSAYVYLSYSGGVLTANTSEDKGWENWEMGDGGEVLAPEELAKVSQLPAENRLVPTGGGYGQYLYTDGTNTSWNNAPSPEQYWGYPYDEGQAPVYSNWSVGWHRVVRSEDVLHIVKISVSDYETLVQNQQTDPNTLYLTYEPQV